MIDLEDCAQSCFPVSERQMHRALDPAGEIGYGFKTLLSFVRMYQPQRQISSKALLVERAL